MAEIGHGGKEIVERIMAPAEAKEKIKGLKEVPIRSQIANEVIGITYGFFSPLQGFMGKADVESVCKNMRLANGVIWSIPIVFDLSEKEVTDYGVKAGQPILLTFGGNPMAILEVEEVYDYDKKAMCKAVYGTDDPKHPGCARTFQVQGQVHRRQGDSRESAQDQPALRSIFHSSTGNEEAIQRKGLGADCGPSDQERAAHRTRMADERGLVPIVRGAANREAAGRRAG